MECLADFLTVDIRNIYIGFYGEDGACIRIQIPCGALHQIIASFTGDERRRIVYFRDSSIFYGNRAIISAQHGSLGENAVFSVEGTAGYRSVIIKQTGRKCTAFYFACFGRVIFGPAICYCRVEDTVLNDSIFVGDATYHCIQLAGFLDGVCITEVVGISAGQIQCADALR